MGVKCFFMHLTDNCRRSLRVYVASAEHKCGGVEGKYCNAMVPIDVVPINWQDDSVHGKVVHNLHSPEEFPGAPWPLACERCGEPFEGKPYRRQVFIDLLYRYIDPADGKEKIDTWGRPYKPGAMRYNFWMEGRKSDKNPKPWCGYDGRSISVICPNGHEWMIDSRANNCTMKDDHHHRCWIRHGEPPNLTVDKACEPGQTTCQAGAGSIQAGDYHGFLRNGEFT